MRIEEIESDTDALRYCQAAYARMAKRDFRNKGVRWPITPDRRWIVEQDNSGNWIVSAYDTVPDMQMDGIPLVRWRITPTRLVRMA